MNIRVIAADTVGNLLEDGSFTGFRRGDNQTALSSANWS